MTIRFTLRQLSVFIAVAQYGSATGAGKALAMSQSAVSAALGELELVTNEQLFDRHGRRLVLNDAGRALQPHAIALVEGAENLARDFESTVVSLRIAASTTIGNYVLPGILARFLNEHPTARLNVVIGNTRDVLDAVIGGAAPEDVEAIHDQPAAVRDEADPVGAWPHREQFDQRRCEGAGGGQQ